ncbi:MAG: hypothetical protein ACUZ8E_18660 [Candidatus Anammoxibacter sp.]
MTDYTMRLSRRSAPHNDRVANISRDVSTALNMTVKTTLIPDKSLRE